MLGRFIFAILLFSNLLMSGKAVRAAEGRLYIGVGAGTQAENNVALFNGAGTADTETTTVGKDLGHSNANIGIAYLPLPFLGLRGSYQQDFTQTGSGTVVFSGGGGGTASTTLESSTYGLDLFFRAPLLLFDFYLGGGVFWQNLNLKTVYLLSNPAATVQGDTLKASGTVYGRKFFAGFERFFGPIGFFSELGYTVAKLNKLTADASFNYSNSGNPNAGFNKGDPVNRWVSAAPNGFRGEHIGLDAGSIYLQLGAMIRF